MGDLLYARSDITAVVGEALVDVVAVDQLFAHQAGVEVDGLQPLKAAEAYSTHRRVASTLPQRMVFQPRPHAAQSRSPLALAFNHLPDPTLAEKPSPMVQSALVPKVRTDLVRYFCYYTPHLFGAGALE